MERLLKMLTFKRPHESATEAGWVKHFIEDRYTHENFNGNIVITTDPASKTLFSAHTDTVHKSEGKQEVVFDKNLMLAYKQDDEPLGADDCAGVWLLLEMIDAKVPGTYVFHRGEERGGIGSRWMKEHKQDWLKLFDHAIAFDRRGAVDLITHQGGSRCCSDEFGNALIKALDMNYALCTGGSFTDTKNYIALIPECTNVAVGYQNEHSKNELLDIEHLMLLREKIIKADLSQLPKVREAKDEPTYPRFSGYYGGRSWDDDDWLYGGGSRRSQHHNPSPFMKQIIHLDNLWKQVEARPTKVYELNFKDFRGLAEDDPERFALLLWRVMKGGKMNAKAHG